VDFSEFVKSAGNPEAVYLLMTDQSYLKDRVMEHCRSQIDEAARAFDWSAHDIDSEGTDAVVSRARTLPWMSPRRWIYVRGGEKGENNLAVYLEAPSDKTVMVVECSRKPAAWPKKLPVITLEAGKGLRNWLGTKARKEGFTLTADAASLFLELVGEDLQSLESEFEKLVLWEWESRKISVDSVLNLAVVGREHEVFDLIGALANQDRSRALHLLQSLFDSGVREPQLLSLLYWSFKRVLVLKERLERRKNFLASVKDLKLWSFRSQEKAIRGYSKDRLVDLLLRLREAERLVKTSGTLGRVHLERVIIDT
jgi:DNA polymerase-3 subunit delta